MASFSLANEDDEQILWQNRPAWREFSWSLLLAILLLPLYGLGLIALIYVIIERFQNLYIITEDRVMCEHGILSRDVSEVDILDLRDIALHQSLWQRVIGTGDVGFSSAGQAGVEVVFKGVTHPEWVKEIVRRRKREALRDQFRELGPEEPESDP